MQTVDLGEEIMDPEALARKKKQFEDHYNRQVEEREQQKKLRQIQNEQTKDPKELMLTIQAKFSELHNGIYYIYTY